MCSDETNIERSWRTNKKTDLIFLRSYGFFDISYVKAKVDLSSNFHFIFVLNKSSHIFICKKKKINKFSRSEISIFFHSSTHFMIKMVGRLTMFNECFFACGQTLHVEFMRFKNDMQSPSLILSITVILYTWCNLFSYIKLRAFSFKKKKCNPKECYGGAGRKWMAWHSKL